jgi:hypothetical protein
VGNAKITRLKIIHRVSNSIQTRFPFFGNKYPAEHLSPCRGSNQLAWQVTMSSWFIFPWEVARFSLEAQRLIALQFFPFAPRKEQPHQEASGNRKTVVPGLGSSTDLPIQPRSRDTVQARTVAARNSTDVIRKTTGIRRTKSSNRKRKNRSNGVRRTPRTASATAA